MRECFNRVLAILLVILLVGFQLITTAVYGADLISEQNNETSEENVKFDAKIGSTNDDKSYSYIANIDSNNSKVFIDLEVKNTGYLKDIVIELQDSNYIFSDLNINDSKIKSITANKIELNQINAGDSIKLQLPISLDKQDRIDKNVFGKESKIILNATYVNAKNRERKIEKEIKENLTWQVDKNTLEIETSYNVIRYLTYNNQTIVSMILNNKLKESKIPVNSKQMQISVPEINESKPSNILISALSTANTNGNIDGSNFSQNDWEYNKETGILSINIDNKEDNEGKVAWDKSNSDEFIITYIYDTNTNEQPINISSKVNTNIELIDANTIKNETAENNFELTGKIGDIVNSQIINSKNTLNKGYMYSNIDKQDGKLDTDFSQEYKVEIGLSQALDKILVKESGEFFNDIDASNSIYTKKVKVSQNEFLKILGENGYINVFKDDGTLIGTLNKDVLELEVNSSKVSYEISKPQKEGEISLIVDRAIKGDLGYTKEQIQNFTELKSKLSVNGEVETNMTLEEPTTKASIEISNSNLSTVVKNENVVLTVTLEKDDITDKLYKNPQLIITLPEEVKQLDFKDARLLYEDELIQDEFRIEGNTIYLSLKGIQTKYEAQSLSKGTVIRIVLDLTLDNLLPSKQANITLSYVNENDISNVNTNTLETQSNMQTTQTSFSVVAPEGFVTTNTLSGYNGNETVTSQEGNVQIGKMVAYAQEEEMQVSGTVVNNLGTDANGFKILGRIPFKGNKEVGSDVDLGTTVDTTLASEIKVEGIEAKVYYSTNEQADTDVAKKENGWSGSFIEDAKSYLILANATVPHATRLNFSYNVTIPANVEYGNALSTIYGVYYNNDAQDGTAENLVLATKVGLKTGELPEIQTEISVQDLFLGTNIENGGNVTEGQFLRYNFKVKNTSEEIAENVKLKIILPQESEKVDNEGETEVVGQICYLGKLTIREIDTTIETAFNKEFLIDMNTKEFEETIGSLNPGEEKVVSLDLAVSGKTSIIGEGEENTVKASVSADKMDGTSDSIFNTKLAKGYLKPIVASSFENKKIMEGQDVAIGLQVQNVNRVVKNNVIAKLVVPEGLRYESIQIDSEPGSADFNERTRELTINLGTINANDMKYAEISFIVESAENEEMNIEAVVTCNETQEQMRSNSIKLYNSKSKITASLTSNIREDTVLDTDEIEYYIDIKNEGDFTETINILDNIPEGLNCRAYKIEVTNGSGEKDTEYTAREISTIIKLNAGGSARMIIKTDSDILASGEQVQVTNSPEITVDGEKIEINSLTHTIIGTGGADNPNGQTSYRISGVVWIDENGDGKKDDNEPKLSNQKVSLFDQNTGNLAKDINGNDVNATTNGEGRYTFSNLNKGSYLVIVEYDTANYEITTYQAENVLPSQNSDFVDAKLYDKKVAATNTINTDNYNTYNIDLGLKRAQQFDLKLDKLVNRVTVTNTMLDPSVHEYNDKLALVDLLNTYVEYSTVLVEYTITVTNEGSIPGYAKEIVDYLPEGMAFASDLNEQWYLGKDGNLYTTSLANTIINPGESKTITLVLSRKMTGENTGTVRNVAEISKDYNEYGKADIDSVAGNNQDNEDDKSYADVIIAMGTGKEVASFIGITIGVLAIVGTAVILIKKYIIRRI